MKKDSEISVEEKTVRAMVRIFCRDHHRGGSDEGLCKSCLELLDYAEQRLAHCPFEDKKPACSDCTIHCYRKDMRDRIKEIMRYAGPQMIFRHPVLALIHLVKRLQREKLHRNP